MHETLPVRRRFLIENEHGMCINSEVITEISMNSAKAITDFLTESMLYPTDNVILTETFKMPFIWETQNS